MESSCLKERTVARVDKTPESHHERDEAAICLARDLFMLHVESLLPEAGPQFYKNVTAFLATKPFTAEYDEAKVTELVQRARGGGREDHSVLCEITKDMLQRGQKPIPLLVEYIFEALENAQPPSRPGASPYKYFSRNLEIMITVSLLVEEHGFKLTRNVATRDKPDATESACSIVSRALATLGIHMSEDAVKDAYDYARHLDK